MTNLTGINDSGAIAGLYADSSFIFHGFVDTSGSFQTIDYPRALQSTIWGINDAGGVAGSWFPVGGMVEHGFFYRGGVFSSFDFPDALETAAYGINGAGQIVGYYNDSTGRRHGFLATPVPSAVPAPGTSTLFGTALAGWLFARRRKSTKSGF